MTKVFCSIRYCQHPEKGASNQIKNKKKKQTKKNKSKNIYIQKETLKWFWNFYVTSINIPVVHNNGNIVDFNGANATDSVNFKAKITGQYSWRELLR